MAARISLPLMEDKRAVRSRSRRRHRPLIVFLFVAITTFALYTFVFSSSDARALPSPQTEAVLTSDAPNVSGVTEHSVSTTSRNLVPLEAHIISKCPDTRDCLKEMILPAMIRVYDKVNFTLTYIGTPTENDGVECKHGPGECMGNILELCAHQLYPDPKIWLGFTMCLTRDYMHIPQRELVEDCALEHAVDFDKLNECATRDDGAFGMGMLRDSVQRSASVRLAPIINRHLALANANIQYSSE
ncbi:hypothetical protein F5Y19DRAFT_473001 [Xylariaceae sp. FL1651]|nr:hypothetical protein F5Y19DRAFT_473001 [Xylariaceae sp. FL1651]